MNKLFLLLLPIALAGCCWRTKQKPKPVQFVAAPVVDTPIEHVHHIVGLNELIQVIAQSRTVQQIEAPLVAEKDKVIKQVESNLISYVEHEAMHLVEDYVKSKI